MIQQTFHIIGMRCGACAFTVQKHFLGLRGVKKALVDFGKKELKIVYNNNKVTEDYLAQSLTPLGYSLQKITV